MKQARSAEDAWQVLATVIDPELPVLSIVDLGMVRRIALDGPGVRVAITPTFTACPALQVIERNVVAALSAAGFAPVRVETVLAPPWTTDWMSDQARDKLKAYGIAPPSAGTVVACPRCAGIDSERISAYGSTPCKALYRCRSCLEPFERFKCV